MKNLSASIILVLACSSSLPAETSHTNTSATIVAERSHVQTERILPFSAEQVWKLIAGFNTLPDYHAAVPESRLAEGGAVRYLTISEEAGGGIVVERLMQFDHEAMTFSYKIIELIESPLPLHNYQAYVDLDPIDSKSCKLKWSSKFNAMGSTKEDAEAIIRAIYKGCYDGIERVLSK
ncbi:MAG: SRPBCC family protein [Opitutales bacterium]